MVKEFFLIKKMSKKEGKEPFTYVQLICDLGYEKFVVSMDKDVIAKLLDLPVYQLFQIDYDFMTSVAELHVKGEF